MLMYYAFTPNTTWQTSMLYWYCSSNLCKWNYLYGDLPFFKIQVNHFMAQDEPFGVKIITKCILWVRGLVPFWVLRHFFLSLTDCQWLYNIQLETSRGALFLTPSDAYVRSFLYLLYTLIKLYYTKALSHQASSLVPDWILFFQGPRIPASLRDTTIFHHVGFSWEMLVYTTYFLLFSIKKKNFYFEIILNSLEVAKRTKGVPQILHPVSPNGYISQSYSTIICN